MGSSHQEKRAQRLSTKIHPSADVSELAHIGEGTSVWHLAQVREGAQIGENCIIGRGVYVGSGVHIGENSKLQNYALVYEPAVIGSGVFIGPGVVLTNDTYPRAVTPNGSVKSPSDWEATGVKIHDGASIGAHATCIAPVTIGAWAVVAAGAVVTKDVRPFALVAGVPARQVGWVGPAGKRLIGVQGIFTCPDTGERFREISGDLAREGSDG